MSVCCLWSVVCGDINDDVCLHKIRSIVILKGKITLVHVNDVLANG